ncbi:MAG: hypothetical protein V4487_03560, partial [Chlamydiota bacterium]
MVAVTGGLVVTAGVLAASGYVLTRVAKKGIQTCKNYFKKAPPTAPNTDIPITPIKKPIVPTNYAD